MITFLHENELLSFGGPMTAIALFLFLVITTLVVFRVDFIQKKPKNLQ
jgi:hypothetical protein